MPLTLRGRGSWQGHVWVSEAEEAGLTGTLTPGRRKHALPPGDRAAAGGAWRAHLPQATGTWSRRWQAGSPWRRSLQE